jgi:GNAT superfamily N-acetyltransferase
VKLRSHFDPAVSHTIEALAARAWPADEVHEVEGWLLRRTEGVDRRRSNSLLPPTDPAHAARTIDLALATAEELDVTPTIQVSPAESHRRLDQALEDRGMTTSGHSLVLAGALTAGSGRPSQPRMGQTPSAWRAIAGEPMDVADRIGSGDATDIGGGLASGAGRRRTSLMDGIGSGTSVDHEDVADRVGSGASGRPVADAGGDDRRAIGGQRVGVGVDLSRLSAAWVDAWASVSGLSGTGATAELVLSQLGDRARFAVATDATGSAIAVGIGVLEDGWLGVLSLATIPTARRHGAATAVVDTLEAWALSRRAHATCLQVERDNAPALAFYVRRGLSIAHPYHYRSA